MSDLLLITVQHILIIIIVSNDHNLIMFDNNCYNSEHWTIYTNIEFLNCKILMHVINHSQKCIVEYKHEWFMEHYHTLKGGGGGVFFQNFCRKSKVNFDLSKVINELSKVKRIPLYIAFIKSL